MARSMVSKLALKGLFLLTVGALSLGAVGPRFGAAAAADPAYTPGQGWVQFTFPSCSASLGVGAFNTEGAFTFPLFGFALLRVTDVDCEGDQYGIYNQGGLFYATSGGIIDATCMDPHTTGNPDSAYNSGFYGRATVGLFPFPNPTATPWSLTFQELVAPFCPGNQNDTSLMGVPRGFFRVDPVATVGNALEILREMLALGLITSSKYAELSQSLTVASAATPGSALYCASLNCALCIGIGLEGLPGTVAVAARQLDTVLRITLAGSGCAIHF